MKRNFNKKKLLTFGIVSLFALALVSAAIVSHFATVQADIDVKAPITLEQSLFTFGAETEVLNDGQNHYLLIKGMNHLAIEVPATAVITITKNGHSITDTTGLHLAVDAGGDMHYAWDEAYNPDNEGWKTWMLDNADWFDWIGTEAYEDSGFENPVINDGTNSWDIYDEVGGIWENGVMTIPGINPDPGMIAALLVVRADPGLEIGEYTFKVELNPVTA